MLSFCPVPSPPPHSPSPLPDIWPAGQQASSCQTGAANSRLTASLGRALPTSPIRHERIGILLAPAATPQQTSRKYQILYKIFQDEALCLSVPGVGPARADIHLVFTDLPNWDPDGACQGW